MSNKPLFGCTQDFLQAYETAQSLHNNFWLGFDCYIECLLPIINKHLGEDPQPVTVSCFLSNLHTKDLYLTFACAQQHENAWQQFDQHYRAYLLEVAKHECPNLDAAMELVNNLMTDLYFSDRSNRPRIASYEGRSSLAAWLRVVVVHRAINEYERKWNSVESLEDIPDIEDQKSLEAICASVRGNTYRPMILASFKGATKSLTRHEQYLLLMRYEQELQAKEIARMLNIHPSRITRQLQRIQGKLKREVIAILAKRYQLCSAAIEECLSDMVENSEYSLLEFLKAS
jgi:RNA polymerase sigma-70 factor, ECF subfamily